MNEPSKSVVLWNKGRRSWDLKRVDGVSIKVGPNESIEMDEISGLRKLADYPRDFTLSKSAGPSSEDLRRREQSIKDREKHLDEREAAIKAREDKEEGPPPSLGELVTMISPYLSDEAQIYLSEDDSAWRDGLMPSGIKIENFPDVGNLPPDAEKPKRGRKPKSEKAE